MPAKKGDNYGGVRCLEALRQRCVIDDITGCWLYPWSRMQNSPSIWLPAFGKVVTLGRALHYLATGREITGRARYVAMCGRGNCCNVAHRKVGTMSEHMRVIRPVLSPAHRAAIKRTRSQHRHPAFSPELRAEILSSSETGKAIADRLGMHPSMVSAIRRGKAWTDAVPVASIFHLGARGCNGR